MTNFALQLKEKKFWKKTKMHLPIIWIERISLLQVYFRHFLQNSAQYLKMFVVSKVLNFVLLFVQWYDLLWTCKLVI